MALDWIVQKFSELPSLIGGIVSKVTFGLSDKVGSAISNVRNSVVNNNSTTTASIVVNGAGNPSAVGAAVDKRLKMAQSNTGGVARA